MQVSLIKQLVQRGILRENTEIEAHYRGYDISGSPIVKARGIFLVRNIKIIKGVAIFETVSTVDGSKKNIEASDVLLIDGMDYDRLIASHDMDDDGEKVYQGKRRGRKPKVAQ
jgi:hypothetical protein